MIPATLKITPVDGVYEASISNEFTVNLGNYNSKKFGGYFGGKFSAEHSAAEIGEHLGDKLYEMLNDEIKLHKDLAPRDSYIHLIATTD